MNNNNHAILRDLCAGCILNDDFVRDNFAELLRFATYYEIRLHLWNSLNSAPAYSEMFSEVYDENLAIFTRFENELAKISFGLNSKRIPHCVLVGIPFAKAYYVDRYLRLQEDIDFLIQPSDLIHICEVMATFGYRPVGDPPSANRKHQVFVNQGFKLSDGIFSGRTVVKFYVGVTYEKYYSCRFCDLDKQVVLPDNIPVLNDSAALFHLMLHSHLYDFHPKILFDIYMICNRVEIDWDAFWRMAQHFEATFLSAVCLQLVKRLWNLTCVHIPERFLSHEVLCMSDKFSSEEWWNAGFPTCSEVDLTYLRAELTGKKDFLAIYSDDVNSKTFRRVGDTTVPFTFKV
jgi:hypothetical protein